LFYGKANKKIIPKKLLIIQGAKLGDMVCTTPMFKAVKQKYPKCELVVAGDRINKDILELNKDVDGYILLSKNSFRENLQNFKNKGFDFACITSPSFGYLSALYLAGIPLIVAPKIENGWSPYETKPYKMIRNFVVFVSHKMGHYAPRQYLNLLEPIGIYSEDTTKHLFFSDKAEKKISDFLKKEDIFNSEFIVGISPSAGNKIKQWPVERFSAVADYLYKKYNAKIIIIGAKNDRPEVLEMVEKLDKETRAINTLDMFSIDELKCLISKMKMFVAVDTGPIYIAEAFNVPTIDITGPIDENEQPPIGKLHKVVNIKNREKPQLYVMNARGYDYAEARRQTEDITVGMVIREFDDLCSLIEKDGTKK